MLVSLRRHGSLLFLFAMPRTLAPELRAALAARIRYYNEMGIYDFYRQPVSAPEGAALGAAYVGDNSARIERRDESTQGRGGRGAGCRR